MVGTSPPQYPPNPLHDRPLLPPYSLLSFPRLPVCDGPPAPPGDDTKIGTHGKRGTTLRTSKDLRKKMFSQKLIAANEFTSVVPIIELGHRLTI